MTIQDEPTVVLYDAANAEWVHFEHPQRVVEVASLEQILPALQEIERLVELNAWYAAGFVSYEAAPAFDTALVTRHAAGFPLLWFGLYSAPRRTDRPPAWDAQYSLAGWKPAVTAASYERAIAQIKLQIGRGETYQVNHTFRMRSRFAGDPRGLFGDMLDPQSPGYAGFIDTGTHAICCASPELFFRRDGERVECRPMKGTARRGPTTLTDRAQADWLRASQKNRAENVMIVDMVRNDLGRVAETGSVRVTELFGLERYRTLWQLTSRVSAIVHTSTAGLFAALFPAASITGAPKASTMKIIAALEKTPRRVYTGTIGYLAPGRWAQFNVAIRTVVIDHATGQAEYGVGGGVVWDSTAEEEYAEALLKARILTDRPVEFSLLETLRWTPEEGYFLLDRHLERLSDSAAYFGYACDEHEIRARLQAAGEASSSAQRVRLLLARDGALTLETQRFEPAPADRCLRLGLAGQPVESSQVFLFHKTTRREIYERARREQPGVDDVLLLNERGELTESTIANLVVELDGRLFTPPVSCGLLAGTFRGMLLQEGTITERIILPEELAHCTNIFLVNSLRGWMPAGLV